MKRGSSPFKVKSLFFYPKEKYRDEWNFPSDKGVIVKNRYQQKCFSLFGCEVKFVSGLFIPF
jgi:hypothetical protein